MEERGRSEAVITEVKHPQAGELTPSNTHTGVHRNTQAHKHTITGVISAPVVIDTLNLKKKC